MSEKPKLLLIRNKLSHDQRIQARIDSFRKEIMQSEGDMRYVQEILGACYEYMCEYEDDDIYNACVKVKESLFYINNFISFD